MGEDKERKRSVTKQHSQKRCSFKHFPTLLAAAFHVCWLWGKRAKDLILHCLLRGLVAQNGCMMEWTLIACFVVRSLLMNIQGFFSRRIRGHMSEFYTSRPIVTLTY